MNSISGMTEHDETGGAPGSQRPHVARPAKRPAIQPEPPHQPADATPEPFWKQLAQRLRRVATAPESAPAQQQQQQKSKNAAHTPKPDRQPSPEPVGQLTLPLETSDQQPAPDIPEMLRNRYLIDAQQRYYFRDRQQVMAFEDLGARLRTSHDDPEVAASMVVLAQAKGWSHLKLRGSAAFKREAWLAAAERGLQVSGHRPSALDKARLAERLTERETQRQRNANEIAPATRVPDAAPPKTVPRKRRKNTDGKQKAAAPQLTPPQREAVSELEKFLRQRGDSEEAVAMTLQIATDKLAHHRTHFGELIEHGDAPYQHDRENDMSYFATLQTRNGKQIIWGIDLQRALAESGAAIGDDIVLVQQGRRPVEVSAPERDASGRKTGKRVALDADRNNWDVVSLDNARDFASERSQPPKSMQTTRGRSNNTLPPEHTAGLEQARQHVR